MANHALNLLGAKRLANLISLVSPLRNKGRRGTTNIFLILLVSEPSSKGEIIIFFQVEIKKLPRSSGGVFVFSIKNNK